jgi:hypothetical protein
MKVLTILMVALVLVLLFTPTAMADSSYNYTLEHDLELELDGEFNFNSNVTTPAQGNVDIGLDGVGQAYLKSDLLIMESNRITSNWFDLF